MGTSEDRFRFSLLIMVVEVESNVPVGVRMHAGRV
jgi:hypothetical protein